MQWQDYGHNSESCSFGVMPLVNLEILPNLLIKYDNFKTIKDINIEYLLVMTWDNCKTRDIIPKVIFVRAMPLFNLEFLSKLLIKYDNLITIKDINIKL